MEEKIREEIKTLFKEIKKIEESRKNIIKGIMKERGDRVVRHILSEEFDIRMRLATLTALLKVLLNLDGMLDVHLSDLGKRHIYIGYFKDANCYGRVKGLKYKV